MSIPMEQIGETAQSTVAFCAIRHRHGATSIVRTKGLSFGVFACIFLSFVHLLLKSPCLLFVHERQSCQTLFHFKGMKESAVLVICKGVVDFLVP